MVDVLFWIALVYFALIYLFSLKISFSFLSISSPRKPRARNTEEGE